MKNPIHCKVILVLACLLLPIMAQAGRAARAVETLSLGQQAPTAELWLPGRIEVPGTFTLGSEEEGRLLSVRVAPGARLKKGQEVARIDDTLLRASLEKAIANRRQAEVDLERQLKLRASRVASEDEVARARTALQVARAEEAVLRARIERTHIRAPFAAIVVRRLAEPGTVLAARDPVLLLQPLAAPRVRTWVPAGAASRLERAQWHLFSGNGELLGSANLEEREPALLESAQTLPVRLRPGNALPLPTGSWLQVRMRMPAQQGLWLPLSAIGEDRDGRYAMVVQNGKARRVAIRTGETISGNIRIIEGLTAGMEVVIRGLGGLHDGDAVRPTRKTGEEAS